MLEEVWEGVGGAIGVADVGAAAGGVEVEVAWGTVVERAGAPGSDEPGMRGLAG